VIISGMLRVIVINHNKKSGNVLATGRRIVKANRLH